LSQPSQIQDAKVEDIVPYILTPNEQENRNDNIPVDVDIDETQYPDMEDELYDDFPVPADNPPVRTQVKAESVPPVIKPDLLTMLQEKDRKNREDTMLKVIADAKKLLNDAIIPPVEFSPFEEALMNFVMLPCLKPKHYEFFGIPEG